MIVLDADAQEQFFFGPGHLERSRETIVGRTPADIAVGQPDDRDLIPAAFERTDQKRVTGEIALDRFPSVVPDHREIERRDPGIGELRRQLEFQFHGLVRGQIDRFLLLPDRQAAGNGSGQMVGQGQFQRSVAGDLVRDMERDRRAAVQNGLPDRLDERIAVAFSAADEQRERGDRENAVFGRFADRSHQIDVFCPAVGELRVRRGFQPGIDLGIFIPDRRDRTALMVFPDQAARLRRKGTVAQIAFRMRKQNAQRIGDLLSGPRR